MPNHIAIDNSGGVHVVANYAAPTSGTDEANQDPQGRLLPTLTVTRVNADTVLIGTAPSWLSGG
jgi:hypothetical protein